jgi:hypothetical protein
MTYAGVISVQAVVRDKGYVCSTRVLAGIDETINKVTQQAVRQWRFDPARKNRKEVPAVMLIQVFYWVDKEGKLVSATPPHKSDADVQAPSSVQH